MRRARTWKWAALFALGLISSAPASVLGAPAGAAKSPAKSASATPGSPKPAGGVISAPACNAPYDITADRSELFNEEHRQVYTGNVDVVQCDDRLRTPLLTVFFLKKGPDAPQTKVSAKAPAPGSAGATFGKVERMEAEGPVYYVTPTENAKGDHGTYLAADDTITLTGNVVLVQDKNVGNGDKLIIEKATGHATLYSGNSSQRVRGVFYQEPAQPAPGAAPVQGSPAVQAAPPAKAAPKTAGPARH
jgi:lipopolysaccharide export system protein LptA